MHRDSESNTHFIIQEEDDQNCDMMFENQNMVYLKQQNQNTQNK